ncbi:MAG: hypothetical protein AB9915_01845 [Candidatus Dojkabacteria bacterium]
MELLNKISALFIDKIFAQGLGEGLNEGVSQLESGDITTKEGLVDAIVKIAVPLSVISLILLVVYAGYLLMSSQGNPDKLQEGREIITNAVIGFLVVLLSVAILLLVSNTLGLGVYN